MPRDEATLLDIIRSAQLVQLFVEGMTQEAFLGDVRTQSAVLHQLTIIGEAVKRLSRPFRDKHPSIPWQFIASMRDHLIHGYDAVDMDEVWNTATRDVPALLAALEQLPRQKPD